MVGLEKLIAAQDGFSWADDADHHRRRAEADRAAPRRRHCAIEDLPLDDKKTYERFFSKAYTSGVFQFESPGMRDILRRYQPDRLEDLFALNALYRPGPMGMIDDFVDRKHGRKEVVYDLPEMKEILEETYGVMVYQEQVMQISNLIAGYSLGEADLLRRAMGKKKIEEMAKQRERFVAGAKEKGHPQRKVEKIFDLMEKFAGYGFNKSHSAAYAYLAFVTAYLKAHYPLEFMSALLTSETGNTAKVVKYISECREMRHSRAAARCELVGVYIYSCARPETPGIRFGLGAIKNVGSNAVDSIVKARTEGGDVRLAVRFLRTSGPGRRESPHDRELHQGRRDGFARRHARAVDGGDR